jgi:hypothetical protein
LLRATLTDNDFKEDIDIVVKETHSREVKKILQFIRDIKWELSEFKRYFEEAPVSRENFHYNILNK